MEIVIDNLDQKLEELPLYSYETLSYATDNFDSKNKLGQGGFGPVYKVFQILLELHVLCTRK